MAVDKNGKPLPKGINYRPKENRYMGRFMYHGESFTVYGKTLKETQKNPVSNAVLLWNNKKKSMNVMTEHEQKLFLTYAKDSCFYPIYELALSTGMRNGELRRLQWTDVDFSTKIIHTLIYWNKQYFFDSPKTASSERDIPILNNVYALLKQQQQLQRKKQLAMGELWLPPVGFENLVFTNQKSALVNRNRFKISKCGNPL